jgi:hypothetical protein
MNICVEVYSKRPITNYPYTSRHIEAVRILNAVGRILNGTGESLGKHDSEESMAIYFNWINEGKSKLEGNMCIRNDNIKVEFRETNLVLHLIYLS